MSRLGLALAACLGLSLAACAPAPAPSPSHGLAFAGSLDAARTALMAAGYTCDDPQASLPPLNPSLRPALAGAFEALRHAFAMTTCTHEGQTQPDSIVRVYARRGSGELAGTIIESMELDSPITWAALEPRVTPVIALVLPAEARGVVAAAIQVRLGEYGVSSATSLVISPDIHLRMPAPAPSMSGGIIDLWAPDLEQAIDAIDIQLTATPGPSSAP